MRESNPWPLSLLKLRYSISEAFNREVHLGWMHYLMSGPNFVHGPLTKRQNGGVLVAEKWQVFNMGFVIWARVGERMA
jgi:hypothetical protein